MDFNYGIAHLECAREILNYQKTFLELPFSQVKIDSINQLLADIERLPQEQQKKLEFPYIRLNEDGTKSWVHLKEGLDDGLIVRQGKDDPNSDTGDQKMVFHLRRRIFNLAHQSGASLDNFQASLYHGLELLEILRQEVGYVVAALHEELGRRYPIWEKFTSIVAQEEAVLRMLRYYVRDDGANTLAETHGDRSLITAAVHNSHKGLVDSQGNHLTIPKEKVLLFPGRQLGWLTGGKLTSKSCEGAEITPLKHGVMYDWEQGEYRRSSIVAFFKGPHWVA